MSIATAIQNAQAKVAAAYTACDAKGATMPQTQDLSNLADCIGSISGGGGDENYDADVIFIDYDGKVLYNYTAQEFLALSAMPANPTHEGLTAQGWNWTLADAKAYVADAGSLVIGQLYVTADGKTRFYITLDDPDALSPTFYIPVNSTVNWGDGTTESTYGSKTHTYSSTGDYIIEVDSPSTGGCAYFEYSASVRSVYHSILKHVRLGSFNGTLPTYCFQFCDKLESVTVPNNVTSFQSGAGFDKCISLKAVVLPNNFNSGNYSFSGCTSLRVISFGKSLSVGSTPFASSALERLHLPGNITTFPTNAAQTCFKLRRVTFGSGTTTIQNSAFNSCTELSYVSLSSTITQLADYAFCNTYFLREIDLPSSLTTIGQRVFQGSNIKKITIPANVTSIGNCAFYNCPWLTEVYVEPATPPTAGSGIFQSSSLITKIYVPSGTLSAYQTATNWSTYASKMEEVSSSTISFTIEDSSIVTYQADPNMTWAQWIASAYNTDNYTTVTDLNGTRVCTGSSDVWCVSLNNTPVLLSDVIIGSAAYITINVPTADDD